MRGGGSQSAAKTILVAVLDDNPSREALQWAVSELSVDSVQENLLVLLHVVSSVPNKGGRLVKLSEADAPSVASHIYKTVLPFLESLTLTYDTKQIPTEINVIKNEAKGEAILEEAKKLGICKVALGKGPKPGRKWRTIEHCITPSNVPSGCTVCVIEKGQLVLRVPPNSDLQNAQKAGYVFSPSSVLGRQDEVVSPSGSEDSSPINTPAASELEREVDGGVLQGALPGGSSTWAGSGAVTRRTRWLNSGQLHPTEGSAAFFTPQGSLTGPAFAELSGILTTHKDDDTRLMGEAEGKQSNVRRIDESSPPGNHHKEQNGTPSQAPDLVDGKVPGSKQAVVGKAIPSAAVGTGPGAASANKYGNLKPSTQKELSALELARAQYKERAAAGHPRGSKPNGLPSGLEKKGKETAPDSPFVIYSRSELAAAVDYYKPHYVLGEGTYGIVLKGMLRGREVAIKQLKNPNLRESRDEIEKEVDVQRRIDHPNCVRLLGYNIDERTIVYELCPNGNLEESLVGKGGRPPLLWPDRCRLAMEVASGLLHLHSQQPAIVHRDVKPANVLLDAHFQAKLGDVGLARMMIDMAPGHTHVARKSVRVGTQHYVDPEYLCARRGYLGPKSDVFSFGIVLLQMLVGGIPNLWRIDMAVDREELGPLLDPRAGSWPIPLAMDVATLGLWCAEMERKDRPDLRTEVIPALLEICEAAAREMLRREADDKRRQEDARKRQQAEQEMRNREAKARERRGREERRNGEEIYTPQMNTARPPPRSEAAPPKEHHDVQASTGCNDACCIL